MTASFAVVWFVANSVFAAMNPGLPSEETEGAIAYMSGGTDQDQASAMKHAASKYSLELDFLLPGQVSAMPAAIPVTITDSAGNLMLDRDSYGPLMLVQLPEGRYTITAQNAGKIEKINVNIAPGQHKTIGFDWKG
jgi:hypothetical protein